MLDIKKRQSFLAVLGFYDGKIDGIEGKATKAAYLALQKKYFKRKSDCDGLYGADTDKLLLNAIRVKNHTKNFELEEFRCKCGKCTGYPAYLSIDLLDGLQNIRDKYKKPVTLTSAFRCLHRNAELSGSIGTSRHVTGKAADHYIPGITTTEDGRIGVMDFWYKQKGARFAYCYLPTKWRTERERTATYMGDKGGAVHVEVK